MTESRDSNSKNYRKFQIDIGDYIILNQIESGGFGLVYAVQNTKTKYNCAAKVLNTLNDESQYKKMINREIGIMIRCQHPTIIKFIGFSFEDFNHQKNVTIFMDLAKKGSLTELLRKSQKGLLDEIVDNTIKQIILVGIARGMMILHQHHIIHRDLKPGNILLDKEYHPLITDFGLSKFYETGRSMIQSQQCGTSMYMAPEIIEGNRYNGKVDVYSFGILMYEVVTNSIPYPSLYNGEMTHFSFNKKVVEEDLRPKFEFPINKSIQKLIESCWSKDPKERPTFEEIFKKLAYNIDDLVDNIYEDYDFVDKDSNENNYYLDGVDVNEVIAYANDIDNPDHPIKEEEEILMNNLVEKIINPLIKENEEIKNKIFAIQKEKDELQKELLNMVQTTNNISLENVNMKSENDIIKNQISNVQSENKKLRNDLYLTNQNNNNIKQENIEIKKQITELKIKLDELVKKTNDFQNENEEMKMNIAAIQKENQELKKKLDESFPKTINIQNEFTNINEQINDTQENLSYINADGGKDDEKSLLNGEKENLMKKHEKIHKEESKTKINDGDTDYDLSDKSSNEQKDKSKQEVRENYLGDNEEEKKKILDGKSECNSFAENNSDGAKTNIMVITGDNGGEKTCDVGQKDFFKIPNAKCSSTDTKNDGEEQFAFDINDCRGIRWNGLNEGYKKFVEEHDNSIILGPIKEEPESGPVEKITFHDKEIKNVLVVNIPEDLKGEWDWTRFNACTGKNGGLFAGVVKYLEEELERIEKGKNLEYNKLERRRERIKQIGECIQFGTIGENETVTIENDKVKAAVGVMCNFTNYSSNYDEVKKRADAIERNHRLNKIEKGASRMKYMIIFFKQSELGITRFSLLFGIENLKETLRDLIFPEVEKKFFVRQEIGEGMLT